MPSKTCFIVEVCPLTYERINWELIANDLPSIFFSLAVDKIGLGHLQRFLMLFYCLSSILYIAVFFKDSLSSLSCLLDNVNCQFFLFSLSAFLDRNNSLTQTLFFVNCQFLLSFYASVFCDSFNSLSYIAGICQQSFSCFSSER